LGEGGARLSGGERRRVALARALVRGAAVILLDEPTSGLDKQSEQRIIESIRAVSSRRTILTVTHSPSVAQIADRVFSLEHRKLVPVTIPDDRPRRNEVRLAS
jgi:ABC-type transport system involved in cytochrome bd biosynthesis fused ATPase/permease subunit